MDDRLGRVEHQLDEIRNALTTLVRVEERMSTVFKQLASLQQELASMQLKVEAQATAMARRDVVATWLDRFAGAAIAATLGVVVQRYLGG